MVKVLIVRAEMGRVTESRVVEGDLGSIVKSYAQQAILEWDPGVSDFVVIREDVGFDLEGLVDDDTLRALEELGFLERSGGSLRVRLPVYTISFDNRALGEDQFIENKVYMITLYVNDDVRAFFEAEAASITTQEAKPGGVVEL